MKTATLCFLLRDNQICLAEKKIGFGKGKLNGFGGKVGDKPEHKNETPEQAVQREAREEFGEQMGVSPDALEKVAELTFFFENNPDSDHFVHVYLCRNWSGEPQETEEMKPVWYPIDQIPYDLMWKDDKFWLPKVLKGELLKGSFNFNQEGNITRQEIETTDLFRRSKEY